MGSKGGRIVAVATLTSKGQLTVPKEVRDALGAGPGSKLLITVNPEGKATLEVVHVESLVELGGSVPLPPGVQVPPDPAALRAVRTRRVIERHEQYTERAQND